MKLSAISIKPVLLTVFLVALNFNVFAIDYTAVASGNWTDGNTWGTGPGGDYPGKTATAGTVTIASGYTVTLDADITTYHVTTLTITGTTTTSLTCTGFSLIVDGTINIIHSGTAGTTNVSLDVNTGTVTCNAISHTESNSNNRDCNINITTGTLNVTTDITMGATAGRNNLNLTGAGTINIGGTISNGTVSLSAANSTVEYNKAGDQTVRGTTYYNLKISGSGTKTLGAATTVSGSLSVDAGTLELSTLGLTANGTTSVTGTLNDNSNTGTNTFAGAVTVNPGGVWATTTTTTSARMVFRGGITSNGTSFAAGGATFDTNPQSLSGSTALSFAGTVTVTGVAVTNNTTVTMSATAAGTLTGTGGTWTQGSGSTLNYAGSTMTTLTLDASTNANTVNYNRGGNQTVYAVTYSTLGFSVSGTKTLTSLATVNADLNFSSTSTLAATTAANLSVGGNLSVGDGVTFTVAGYDITITGTTTVGGGTSGSLVINNTTGTKIFTGLVTVSAGGTWNNSGNEDVTFRGGITNSGTFTAGSGVQTFDTNPQALTGTITIASITVTGITLTNNNTLTVSTALNGTGGLTQAASSTLYIGFAGPPGITVLTATAANNTVEYNRAGDQTTYATTYYSLNASGSGTKTFGDVTSVNGDITVSGTATLADGGHEIAGVGGKTFTLGSGTAYTTTKTTDPCFPTNMTYSFNAASTVNINGTGSFTFITQPTTFGNLSFGSGSSTTKTLKASTAVTVNGTLTISASNEVADNGNTITAKGNVVNNGTHSGAGKIYLNSGSGAHAISGATSAFGNVELDDTQGATATGTGTTTFGSLTLTSGTLTVNSYTTALTVSGATNISGTLTLANNTGVKTFGGLVTLNSGGTFTSTSVTTAGNLIFQNGITNNGTSFAAAVATFDTRDQSIQGSTAHGFSSTVTVTGFTVTNYATVNMTSTGNPALTTGSTGTWKQENGSTLNYTGQSISSSITLNASTTSNTVDYNRGGTQTILGATYYNLKTSGGSGTKTLGGATVVKNTLDVGTGTTYALSTYDCEVDGITTVTGTHNDASATGTNLYKGKVTINGSWTNSNSPAFEFQGGLEFNGTTFTSSAGVYTFSTNSQDISGSQAMTFSGNVAVSGAITLTNTNASTVTITGTLDGNNASSVFDNRGYLYYGNLTQPFNTTGSLTASYTGNTVDYSRANTQTIRGTTYYDLKTSGGAGTKTLGANTVVSHNLDVGTGTTFRLSTYDTEIDGTTSVTGTLTDNSGTGTNLFIGKVTINSGGTWNFSTTSAAELRGGIEHNGTTFTSSAGVYTFSTNSQSISGTSAMTFSGNVAISGAITLTNSNSNVSGITITGTLDGNNASSTFDNRGYFYYGSATKPFNTSGILTANYNSNTVDYTRNGTQTIYGTTYHNLTISTGNTKTLSTTTTVNNTLTISAGTLADAGYTVTVKGDVSNAATHSGAGKMLLSGGSAKHNINGNGTFGNFELDDAQGAILGNAVTFSGNINITSGTFEDGGYQQTGTTGKTFTVSNGATYITTRTGTSWFPSNVNFSLASNSTVKYNGAGVHTLPATPTNYGNIEFNNNTKTLGSGLIITGSLTIGASTTLDVDNTNNYSLNVAGNWNNSGTFTARAGTVTFDGSSTQNVSTNGSNFYRVIVNANTVQLSSAITITNNLTLTSGVLDQNGQTFTTSASATISRQNGSIGGAGTLTFGANTDVTYTATSSITVGKEMPTDASNLRNLALNGSGLDLSLASSITVNGTLTMTSGTLNLNGNNITLCSTCNIASETNTNRIYGTSGYIQITKTLNAPSAENPGNLGAVLTSSANLGSTTIKRGHTEQTGNGNHSVLRYYDIDPTNGGLQTSLTISYFDNENNGITSNQKLYFSTNTGSTWREISPSGISTVSNLLSVNINPSWPYPGTRWTVGGGGAPLPIELISFSGVYENKEVNLYWSTAAEINNDYFTIERSTDSKNFEIITTVKGAGNSNEILKYSTTDDTPPLGIIYYRLKQTDFDGKYKYSDIISVKADGDVPGINVSQPYFDGSSIKATIRNMSGTDVYVEIYNILGAIYFSEVYKPAQSNININLKPAGISKGGVYFLRVGNGKESIVKKFVY